MPGTPLAALLRLRRQERDEAQKMLADAQLRAMTSADAVKIAEQNMVNERDAALDLAADDRAVEAYSRWLPIGRGALERARSREQDAAMDVESSRTRLTFARAALEAAEKLAEIRQEEVAATLRRREQNALDEIASRGSRQMKS